MRTGINREPILAKLYFSYSTMNAGKSTLLLQASYNYRERGMRTVLFIAAFDDRGGEGRIASRIGLDSEAHTFRPEDNLESHYARDALRQLYLLLVRGKVEGCSLERFEAATGLKLMDSNGIKDDLPPITTFLNRLLALTIEMQGILFSAFEQLLAARIDGAIASGTYDMGLETLRAESFIVTDRQVIHTHPGTGAETRLLTLTERKRNQPVTLDAALAESGESAMTGLAGALRGVPLFARLSLLADYIEFGWAKWVLGYNQQNQLEFLSRWLGQVTPQRMVMALAAVGGVVMLIMLGWMLWRVRRPALVWWQREHRQMTRMLARRGVPLAPHLTSGQIVRLASQYYPAASQPLQDWQRCYDTIAYRKEITDPVVLRRQLRNLRRLVGRRLILQRKTDRQRDT